MTADGPPDQAFSSSRLIRVVAGGAVWLALMAVSYFLLVTVPALVLLGFWIAVTIYLYLRHAPVPGAERERPGEEDPLGSHRQAEKNAPGTGETRSE